MQNLVKTALASSLATLALNSGVAQAITTADDGNNKRVGNVHWHKIADIDSEAVPHKTIPQNAAKRATHPYNLALSQRRVDDVRKVCIDQYSIASNRLTCHRLG